MMKPSSDFFESSSIQSNDKMIDASQFSMTIFERETSVQIGEGLIFTKCSCEVVIQAAQSIASKDFTSCRNYRWKDFSSILAQT